MKEDQQYYQSFLDGNQEGFESLVYRYREPLIFFLYQIVRDLYAAEELAQDAFVEVLIHKELKEELRTAIQSLKREYQIILYLIDIEELSYKEASMIIERTLPQTKVLIYRVRKALKKQIVKEECSNEK